MTGLIVDLFAGGGGASEGIRLALGRCPDVVVDYDADAIAMHEANHPSSQHLQEDVFSVDPVAATAGRPVSLLWASPSCTNFSVARGDMPLNEHLRSLAWVIVDGRSAPGLKQGERGRGWARDVRPAVIVLENVAEFQKWGPLGPNGRPIKSRAGETFREFVSALVDLGYCVEWRVLCAADYGAPTSRRRLFLVARRDGLPIVWPTPTHGPGRSPLRTAAECIDWSIPTRSIFGRKKPLAENTLRRIAEGIRRYVVGTPTPFIVSQYGQSIGRSADAPLPTITAGGMGHQSLVVPTLVQTGYGEREGQSPRCLNLRAPLGTVVTTAKHGLVAAFLAKHYGGVVGQPVAYPIGTITTTDHHSVVSATLDNGLPDRSSQVAALLARFRGAAGAQMELLAPTTGYGLANVMVDGEAYRIVDIGMRMLEPRELATAQGFRPDYILTGNKTQQGARIGNSVCPPVAAAVVRANTAALAGAA